MTAVAPHGDKTAAAWGLAASGPKARMSRLGPVNSPVEKENENIMNETAKLEALTRAQVEGRACIRCGREGGTLVFAGILDDGAHGRRVMRCQEPCDGELPAWMRRQGGR